MLKRLLSLFLALSLLISAFPALAEEYDDVIVDTGDMTDDEIAEMDDTQDTNDEAVVHTVGPIYEEKVPSDFNSSSPAIYTCVIKANFSLFSQPSSDSARVHICRQKTRADVLFVGQVWAICRVENKIGYIKRQNIYSVTPVDPDNTVPYGVQKSVYIATTATECHIRQSMSENDENLLVLNPGTLLSVWQVIDEWAVVIFKRTLGYIHINELTDLIPVSPTDTPMSADTPIAAYTSYYNMSQEGTNPNRIINIYVACQRLTRVMQPGESLDFNKQVGPFTKGNGYQQAIVLSNGTTKINYGGGTCQVSSTLYNALLQLPGLTILQRRPHGPSGASYLPHGVDAAVGNDALNLRFRNDYDFPIRVEGHSTHDGALCMVIYRADME